MNSIYNIKGENMNLITILTKKKITDNLTEIEKKSYEIPDYIFCSKDDCKGIMSWSSFSQRYNCNRSHCPNTLTGEEFVKRELEISAVSKYHPQAKEIIKE